MGVRPQVIAHEPSAKSGSIDSGSPIDEVRRGVEVIGTAYESIHAEKNFSYYIEKGSGHVLSPEMWNRTRDVFARHLKA